MKKVIASITFLCYFAVTSGVIVNFHYCMNRLASTEFYSTGSKECGKCGMKTHSSHGCCRDEVKLIKMEVDQKAPSHLSYELPALDAADHVPATFIAALSFDKNETRQHQNHSPPLLTAQDIYLQNCVFRI